MKKTRKCSGFISILFCGLLILSLAACSTSGDSPSSGVGKSSEANTSETIDWETYTPSGTFVYWNWNEETLNFFAEMWENKFPDVTIEKLLVAHGDYVQKLQTGLAAGTSVPDIVLGEKAFRGTVFDLDLFEDISAAPYNFDKADLLEASVQENSNREGELLGFSQQLAPYCMAYRRDLTEQYFGVSEPDDVSELISTWDQFLEAGLSLAEQTDEVYMMASYQDLLEGLFLCTADASAVDYDTNTYHVTSRFDFFNTAYDFLQKGFPVGQMSQGSTEWNSTFAEGNVVFYGTTSWALKTHIVTNTPEGENAGLFGICRAPGETTGIKGGCTVGVCSASEDKLGAYALVRWMFGTNEGTKEWNERKGWIPGLKSYYEAYGDEETSGVDAWFGGQLTSVYMAEECAPYVISDDNGSMFVTLTDAYNAVCGELVADPSITGESAIERIKEEVRLVQPDAIID